MLLCPILFLVLKQVRVKKGCMSQSTLSAIEGTMYDDTRMCYATPAASDVAADKAEVKAALSFLPGSETMKVRTKRRSETCVCYGYTEEADPMAVFNRARREAAGARN